MMADKKVMMDEQPMQGPVQPVHTRWARSTNDTPTAAPPCGPVPPVIQGLENHFGSCGMTIRPPLLPNAPDYLMDWGNHTATMPFHQLY